MTFAPFEYQENGKLTGLDIELGAEIAKAMGLEPAPLNIEFKGLIPALLGSRIDAINSAMYINPERSQQVDFVPYMRIGNEIRLRCATTASTPWGSAPRPSSPRALRES